MKVRLTQAQITRLLEARKGGLSQRRSVRNAVFSEVRREYPALRNQGKFKVAIEDPMNPNYGIIRSKYTGNPLDDGKPEPVTEAAATAAVAEASSVALTVATGASPAAAAAPAADTAPAVAAVAGAVAAVADSKSKAVKAKPVTPFKTADAKPAAAKKAPAKKAAAKAAPAPAKKAAAKSVLAEVKPKVKKTAKGSFSPTKTDVCNIEVRATIDGARKRLGWVSSEEMKAKIVADAKAAAAK